MFASAGLAQAPSIVHDQSMDFMTKVDLLLEQKGWTQYRLEQEAGLAQECNGIRTTLGNATVLPLM